MVFWMAAPPAAAQVQRLLGYQGRLLRSDGTAATGTASATFGIYGGETGGTPLWSETQTLGLSDGYYSTFLGLVVTAPDGLFDGGARWLEIRVGSETLVPRQQVGVVPGAMTAQSVNGGSANVTWLKIGGATVIDAAGRLAGTARYSAGPGLVIDDASQTASLRACASGQILLRDDSTWACATPHAGTVTGVSAEFPLGVTDGSTAPAISIPQAATGSSGYLSSTDWSSFNAKYGSTTTCGGDLTGVLGAPTVARLQSRPVSATAPAWGQVLKWNGAQWEPQTDADSGGTVTFVSALPPLTAWTGSSTPQLSIAAANGSTDGYLASGDWSKFNAKYEAATQCGGDLAGTLASPLVAKLQGVAVSSSVPAAAQVLRFNGTLWVPASLAIGDVGGLSSGYLDLSGDQTIGGAKTFTAAPTFSTPLGAASGGTGTATASANAVFAGPASGSAPPAFRTLVEADLPALDASRTTSGTFGVTRGGTGLSGYTTGDLLYASAPGTLSSLADVAAGSVLISGGSGAAPSWGKATVSHLSATGTAGDTTFLRGDGAWSTAATSVGLAMPAMFAVSGSPVTSSGTLTAALVSQGPNQVFAGPTSGTAPPGFRSLDSADIPSLDAAKIGAGTLPVGRGGTGSSTGSVTGPGPLSFTAGTGDVTLTPGSGGSTILNGNVGIGTTAPAARLVLDLGSTRDGIILTGDGNAAAYSDVIFSVKSTATLAGTDIVQWRASHRGDGYFSGGSAKSTLEFYGTDKNGNYRAPLAFKANGDVLLASPGGSANLGAGNVGVGVTLPAAKLEVAGGVKIGDDAADCSGSKAGTIRWNGGHFQGCNGTVWLALDNVPFSATGGTVTYSGGYTIHTFLASGTFTPNDLGNVDVLVVGGGGSGGGNLGGGGGGGGVVYATAFLVTAQAYTVTVGAGGTGVLGTQPGVAGNNGGNSVFGSLTANGGGGGGAGDQSVAAKSGGSGGGASGYGTAAGGAGTSGQGYAGGNGGGGSTNYPGGGGGGAGGAGSTASPSSAKGASGGPGVANSINGTSYYWGGGGGGGGYVSGNGGGNGGTGGGGGGGADTGTAGTGGAGLNPGGAGSVGTTTNACKGGNGGANTGGGGGGSGHSGGYWSYSGNGGSGIVIVRYLTQ